MNIRAFVAGTALLSLASCGGTVALPPTTSTDIADCVAALAASGITNPSAMVAAALQTPACMTLTQDLIALAVSKAAPAAQAAARARMVR